MLNCPPESHPDVEPQAQPYKRSLIKCLNYCQNTLLRKYSSQREYYHSSLINHILDSSKDDIQYQVKFAPSVRINTVDIKYDDWYEYLHKFHNSCDSIIEMAQICEYYKYYLESPIVRDHHHFNIFYVYGQKKKEIVYKKLQNILDCTKLSSEIRCETGKTEKPKTGWNQRPLIPSSLDNILKDISLSLSDSSENESRCFLSLNNRLIKRYGISKTKNMEQADRLYSFKKLLNKAKPLSFMKKSKNLKSTKSSIKIPNRKQIMKRIMLQSTNNSSLQQGQSNFNVSKNLGQNDYESKNSEHCGFRKKKIYANIKGYERSSNNFQPPSQFAKDIQAIYGVHRKQQTHETKKKLRKRSCQNIFVKKFKTLEDDNLIDSPYHQKRRSQNLQVPDFHSGNEKVKMKSKRSRNYIKSCQIKLQFKKILKSNQQMEKNEIAKINRECSPSFSRHRSKNIKETIEIFKNKIRQQMKQLSHSKENERKQNNMLRFHTSQASECSDKAEKYSIRDKKRHDQSTDKNKGKKAECTKNGTKYKQGNRK